MDKSITLLNEIINVIEEEDIKLKKSNVDKGSLLPGESWTIFHLKALREMLVTKENKENEIKSQNSESRFKEV